MMKKINPSFAKLEMYRIKKGIDKKALADTAGISIQSFYSRLNGETLFDVNEITVLSRKLDIPQEEVLEIFLPDLFNHYKQDMQQKMFLSRHYIS